MLMSWLGSEEFYTPLKNIVCPTMSGMHGMTGNFLDGAQNFQDPNCMTAMAEPPNNDSRLPFAWSQQSADCPD